MIGGTLMKKYFDCFDEQKALVKELVGIRSVVGSDGSEQTMAEHIHGIMSGWDYFRKRPDDLFLVPTDADTIGRSSVVAVVRTDAIGTSQQTAEAVLLLGHIDTVETSDYGVLEPLACSPDELQTALRAICSDEVARDIDSGRYMFGRGALDMKSGVACYMYVLKHFSENRSELKGNLIALFECDEEGDSHGMITSVRFIKELAEKENMHIKAALCADYSSNEAAAYLGTIGKYLPCVMAFGKSSHVGQVFSSVDPNLIISETVCALEYNTALCEENLGEMTQPPVSLKQSDMKQTYSVQTADSAYAYFNWFSLKKTEDEILEICRTEARKAAERAAEKIAGSHREHIAKLKASGAAIPQGEEQITVPVPKVMTINEYAKKVGKELREPDPFTDIRQFWISEAARLRSADREMSPVVLVFMAGVSYTPVTVDPGSELGTAVSSLGIPVRTYYPFISDASFVSRLGDVPVINLGTYGKDAHMFTERADMEYCFDRLPNLTWELLVKILG